MILPFPSFFFYFTTGPLLLIITSLNILPSAHLFFTFPLEQGRKVKLPVLFSSFFTPHSLFLTLVWQCYHFPLQLIIPAGSHQTPDQKEGVKSCNSSHLETFHSFFSERVMVGDHHVCTCVRDSSRERNWYSGVSSFMLSGCFLESKQQGTTGIGSKKRKQKRWETGKERQKRVRMWKINVNERSKVEK